MDRLKEITTSIGFGEIIQCPTTINDNYSLPSDLGELLDFLERYIISDKERLAAFLQMVSDYSLTCETIKSLSMNFLVHTENYQ